MEASELTCSVCNEPAIIRKGDYQNDLLFGFPLLLKDIKFVQCTKCGNEDPIFYRLSEILGYIRMRTKVLTVGTIERGHWKFVPQEGAISNVGTSSSKRKPNPRSEPTTPRQQPLAMSEPSTGSKPSTKREPESESQPPSASEPQIESKDKWNKF